MQTPPDLADSPLSRHIGKTAQAGGDIIPGVGSVAGGLVGVGTFVGQELGGDRITPGTAGFRGNPETQQQFEQALQRRRERFFGGDQGDKGRVDDVEITVEYDVEMGDITIEDIDHRELKREIEREQEKQREEAIRKLKRKFR